MKAVIRVFVLLAEVTAVGPAGLELKIRSESHRSSEVLGNRRELVFGTQWGK